MSAGQVTLNSEDKVVDLNNPLPVTLGANGAAGIATSDNQIAIIGQLDDVIEILTDDKQGKNLTVRLDQISTDLFYVGKALIGSVDSNNTWQIVKYTKTGNILKSEYANGSELFNQIWNNRLTLNYI
jgi:hypothetical protein